MRLLIALSILLLFHIPGNSQKAPDFTITYRMFHNPLGQPYMEAYFAVPVKSLHTPSKDELTEIGAEITIIISSQKGIVNFDKFSITTSSESDTIGGEIIGQRRIAIPNGEYMIETEISDLNAPGNKAKLSPQLLTIYFDEEEIAFSDIHWLESFTPAKEATVFTKNNLDLIPHLVPFYPTSKEKLIFYVEMYHLDVEYPEEDLLVMYYIRPKGQNEPLPRLQKAVKQTGQQVNLLLGQFDIEELPTGNYELVIEIRNRNNEKITQKASLFQRVNRNSRSEISSIEMLNIKNTFVDDYSLKDISYYLETVLPVAGRVEERAIRNLLSTTDSTLMKKYFYNFWLDRSITNPESAWSSHLSRVNFVNARYSTLNTRGFNTERGRVYLQYGEPNQIEENRFTTGNMPYEIWQYNSIPSGETNVIFVFQAMDIVSNNYRLIHSSANAEIRNDRWREIVGWEDNERSPSFNIYE